MRNYITWGYVWLMMIGILFGSLSPALAKDKVLFDRNNRNIEKWRNTWEDGARSGAKLEVAGGKAEVIGTETDRNYGVVYRHIEWNLDKYPYLEIDVSASNSEWYMIVENPNFENGYIKIQQDTRETGRRAYNIKKASGLRGIRRVRLELGITTLERDGNKGLKFKIRKLALKSSTSAPIIKTAGLIIPDEKVTLQTSMLGWKNRWSSGGSSGAYMTTSKGRKLKIVGDLDNRDYGCVHKTITLDFNEYPKMEVSITDLTAHMYMIFEGSQFRGGYYRLKPVITHKGNYVYDFSKDLSYLQGAQTFVFKMGVTTDNPQIPNKGREIEFYSVKFKGRRKIKLVAGSVASQLIQPPPPLVAAQPYKAQPLPKSYKTKRKSLDRGSFVNLYGKKYKAKAIPRKADAPQYRKSKGKLTVLNNFYQIDINAKNGIIENIVDRTHNSQVSMGNEYDYLWRIMLKNGDYINAKEFIQKGKTKFKHKWLKESKTLKLEYWQDQSVVIIRYNFSNYNYFDCTAEVRNFMDQPIISVDIPKLSFDYRKLDRFYLPYEMGVSFNQRFFKGKRQFKTSYPKLFSDFVNWSLEDGGQFSAYLHWADRKIRPTKINVGYSPTKGECGVFEHGWTTYIKPKQTWKSQPLRFLLGEKVEIALQRYKRDNNIHKAPKLQEKLGRSLFDKMKKGVLLKISLGMNRDMKYVNKYYSKLPKGTIVHFVSWWLEGFDRHMPDYWPVDPTYGSNADFKKSIKLAKQNGLVVIPYTNPTFWNISPTLTKVGGPDAVASKDFNGNPIFEIYPSGGKGWATSPRHPSVQKNSDYVAEKFFGEYGINALFLDQIGARFVYHDMNKTLSDPTDYAQAWYENCEGYLQSGPLMTEQGYDRLIPLMSAFCGLASFTFPECHDYNTWWGEGAWENFPMAQYLSHENALFFHHNLAHEIFCDTDKKIVWYLAHGYHMINGRWVSAWHNQKMWFLLADQLQKKLVSRYTGQPLLNYYQPESNQLFYSAYPDLGILSNISDDHEKNVLNHTISKNGFIASDYSGSFLAGRFSRLFGFDLAEPQYLIIEKKKNKITLTQLAHQKTLLTIPRPKKWKNNDAITVRRADEMIDLVATTTQTISFYANGNVASSGAVEYIIEYDENHKPDVALRVLTKRLGAAANTTIKVGLEAKNKNGTGLPDAQLALSAWLVKRNAPVISSKEGFVTLSPHQFMKTKIIKRLAPGKAMSTEFPLQIPSTAQSGDIIWLKGELISQKGKKVETFASQSIIKVMPPFDVEVLPRRGGVDAGEWEKIAVKVTNNFTQTVNGRVSLELPKNWTGRRTQDISISPGKIKKITFTVLPPNISKKKSYNLFATFQVKQNRTESASQRFKVSPVWRVVAFEGPRVLVKGKKSKAIIRLIAYGDKKSSGKILLKPSEGLKVNRSEVAFNVPEGGEQAVEYEVTATDDTEQVLELILKTEKGEKQYIAKYPVVNKGKAIAVKGDLMNLGDQDIILANSEVEIQAVRDLGGRLLAFYLRKNGANMLYQNYPKVKKNSKSKDWIEYGGINDWFPKGWPGYVWNNRWTAKIIQAGGDEAIVEMSCKTTNGLKLTRRMILPAEGRALKLNYTVTNLTDVPRKYNWYSHPDLAPGKQNFAGEHHRIIVPIATSKTDDTTKMMTDKFIGKIGKDDYEVNEGWAVALNESTNDYFMQIFDPDFITKVGVWQDANFYTMELLGEEKTLKPGEKHKFTIQYLVGNNNWKEEL